MNCQPLDIIADIPDLLEPGSKYFVISGMQLLLTIAILGLAMAGLAIGVIFKREQISGHCGGGQRITIDGEVLTCATCDGDTDKCQNN
ncbi:MAG: hypothetical protein HQ528_09910 [Candidatus Marinimicrobia bacterium]|nr:hypothetical protein [Candidatus Neomarinimicrobiota bacterium]